MAESETKNVATIGEMHVRTLRPFTYFYVSKRTSMAAMKADIVESMAKVAAARGPVGSGEDGPYVFAYVMDGDPETFEMRIGMPVPEGTPAAGEAQVARYGEFHAATLLLTGSLAHITPAWEALVQAMRREGLTPGAESREWYLYWEGDDSPNNVIWLQVVC
jgi:effector-binding domain-containing protein